MAQANASRSGIAESMNYATRNAKLVGFNDQGHICVWSGGYGFNVYDAVGDWSEVRYFSSGDLAAVTNYDTDEAREMAKERMQMDGFDPVE